MKFTRIILAAALVTSAACTKEQPGPEVKEMTSIEAVNPIVVPIPKAATSDGVNVMWEKGDKIALFVSGGGADADQASAIFENKANAPASSASFDWVEGKQPVRQGNNYLAVYPASQLYKWNSSGNKACSMNLPFEQTVTGPGWDKNAFLLASSSTTNKFVFRHCLAYLMFTISKGSTIKSFEVSTGTDGELIASRVSVAVSDDNNVTVKEGNPTSMQSPTITFAMADGSAFPAGNYYVAILPKDYTNGFVWKFTGVDGKVIERNVSGRVPMNAGWVANLGSEKASTGAGIEALKPFDIFNIPKRVSILGDSISTFEGTLVTNFDAENGGAYYPIYENGVPTKVTSVAEQYWYKIINNKMNNAVRDVNNSLRGSMVVRRTQENYLNCDYSARVALYGLGNPDVVFIHGGTNDCTKHSESYSYRPGMYRADMFLSDVFLNEENFNKGFVDNAVYEAEAYKGMTPASIPTDDIFNSVYATAEAADTWDEILALEDRSFIHAYVKLLNMIHFKHPHAKVVMLIGDALTKRAQEAILKIAGHYEKLYGYKCVNFFGLEDSISKASGAHPNGDGFTFMADTIFEQVGDYIDGN